MAGQSSAMLGLSWTEVRVLGSQVFRRGLIKSCVVLELKYMKWFLFSFAFLFAVSAEQTLFYFIEQHEFFLNLLFPVPSDFSTPLYVCFKTPEDTRQDG